MARFRVRGALLFDLLVAAGVLGLTTLMIFNRATPDGAQVLGYLMSAAVLFRRRWPLAVMAVISLAALAQVIIWPPDHDPLPYDLAVLIGMYSVVKYGRGMVGAYLAAATVATGIGIEVVRHPYRWLLLLIWYLGVCGGVWLMAYTMRTRRLYVAGLEERAATLEREREHLARIAVADERAAIARELHDVVAHSLAVMIVQADGGRYAFDGDPTRAKATLETVAATGREALEDMRRLVTVLRGSDPAPAADDDRRQLGLDQLDVLAERARSAGVAVKVSSCPAPGAGTPAVELTVYRIAQEALTNVLRHAGPGTSATVSVADSGQAIELSIVDDGAGQPPVDRPAGVGHGLVGMRERVAVHGGEFTAGPNPDGGWSVTARIPA